MFWSEIKTGTAETEGKYTTKNETRQKRRINRKIRYKKGRRKKQEDNKLRDLDGNEIKNDNVPQKGVQ